MTFLRVGFISAIMYANVVSKTFLLIKMTEVKTHVFVLFSNVSAFVEQAALSLC